MKHSPQFLALVDDAKAHVKEITVADVIALQKQGDTFYFVDVREDSEWEAGHAKGAVHLGKGIIERDIEKIIPDVNAEIILYCGGGFRSALVADSVQKMGYKNVLSLRGGWRAWVDAGGEIQK